MSGSRQAFLASSAGLRYTAYTQFNGARTKYDGFGRNAKDNNSLFLLIWLLL